MEPKNKDKDKDAEPYSGWWLLGIAALGAILCALLFFGFEWTSARNGIDKLGQMGDFFGGMLNPLVSALTLFVAIRVWQFQEKELQATQKALDEQAKTAEQQRQEQRFFDLLNVYQRTLESITQGSNNFSGKGAITKFLQEHKDGKVITSFTEKGLSARQDGYHNEYIKTPTPQEALKNAVKDTFLPLFDHYFRVIFHILTEAEALLGDQHIRYIKLFRAQLSRSELIILGFNLWLDDEGKKMLPLAEKYSLLEHLPNGQLRTELENLHPKVFGHQPEATL